MIYTKETTRHFILAPPLYLSNKKPDIAALWGPDTTAILSHYIQTSLKYIHLLEVVPCLDETRSEMSGL